MWLFTTRGFFSVTRSFEDPTVMQVRARERQDLAAILEFSGIEAEIVETPKSDYRWRVFLAPHVAAGLVMQLAADIDYHNFKSAVGRHPEQTHKLHGLHEIWSIHHGWQQRPRAFDRTPGELFGYSPTRRAPEPEPWHGDEPWPSPTPIAGECPVCRHRDLMKTGATPDGQAFCPNCGDHMDIGTILPVGDCCPAPAGLTPLVNPQQHGRTPARRQRLITALRAPLRSDAEVRAVY